MNKNEENFKIAKETLELTNSILLTTHERTDGDDLGTVLALANHLRSVGKKVSIVIKGGVPKQLQYLPLSGEVSEQLPKDENGLDQIFDLLVISGCSVQDRVNHEQILNLNIPIINFDHHPDNKMYGSINIVDHTKSSVAELAYDFFKFCGWEINHDVAICLLTGIVTDTGIFMHSNTQASTLAAAGELMEKGARVATVTKHTYEGQDIASLKSWSKAIENAYYDPSKQIIYSIITSEEMEALGNPPSSVFQGVVETLNKVPEAKFAMLLKQDNGIIKGSLRSEEYKGVDVQAIAHTMGGGGHKLAAGFSVAGKLAKNTDGKWVVV